MFDESELGLYVYERAIEVKTSLYQSLASA